MEQAKFKFESWKIIDLESKCPRRITKVLINLENRILIGTTCQSPRDQDCKIIGQKHAVAKALKEVANVNVRKIIWNDFFNLNNRTRRLIGK